MTDIPYPTDKYIVSLLDGKTYCWANGRFNSHLKKHGLTYQDYFETYITGKKEFCKFCSKAKALIPSSHVYRETCGAKDCQAKFLSEMKLGWSDEKNAEVNNKRKKTTLAKYGVEVVSQAREVIEKTRATNQRVQSNGKTIKQMQQEKARATKKERYGNEFYNNPQGIKSGHAALDNEAVNLRNERRRATCLEKYGVSNHLMRPEMVSKNAAANATLHEYTLPSGKVVSVQGKEPEAIDQLLKMYREDEIVVSNARMRSKAEIPCISYINLNGNRCNYYPDIHIPSENRLIEVKSRWWYDAGGREGKVYDGRRENNRRKREAAIKAGYRFEFWVWENGGFTVVK